MNKSYTSSVDDAFERYGKAAEKLDSPLLISGRSLFNKNIEDIVIDVATKLRVTNTDKLLEIGCGVGLLLTPLSKYVKSAVGIDHEACLKKYIHFGVPENVQLKPGRWPNVDIEETFDGIIIYSVMHYLKDRDEALAFVNKCLEVLNKNGRILIADIPNTDMAKRFKASEISKNIDVEYRKSKDAYENNETRVQESLFSDIQETGTYLNDLFATELLSYFRKQNLDAFILPQPQELPFSFSREDILIWKR